MKKTKLRSLLTGIMMMSGVLSGHATTTLSGTAPSYAGDKLSFYSYSNMISFRQVLLAECEVSDSGIFECTFQQEETRLIFANLGIYNCYFFTEPGISYDLHLPAKRERSETETLNPYFEPSRVHILAKQIGTGNEETKLVNNEDINFLIRAFNDSFNPHYYKYVVNAATTREVNSNVSKELEDLAAPFDSVSNRFFKDYMKYRIGLLKHYGRMENLKNIAREYYADQPLLLSNPAYMELFNVIFDEYFLNTDAQHPRWNLIQTINQVGSLSALDELMDEDPMIESVEFRELVQIKAIYDGFYSDKFSSKVLLALLDSINSSTENEKNKLCAGNIKNQITMLMPGYPPPGFELLDKGGKIVSLEDFKDRYVYLCFCNSFSYACRMDFELLRGINSRFHEHLTIITIITDGEHSIVEELVSSNNFDWLFLHIGRQPDVLMNYQARVQPSYFLIGRDGKLIFSPAPGPGEEFEYRLFQVMRSRGDI